jgi:hypothetical protein
MKTSDLSRISKTLFVFRALFFTGWALDFGAIRGCVRFYSEFYTGDNPITDSEIAIVDDRWHPYRLDPAELGVSSNFRIRPIVTELEAYGLLSAKELCSRPNEDPAACGRDYAPSRCGVPADLGSS